MESSAFYRKLGCVCFVWVEQISPDTAIAKLENLDAIDNAGSNWQVKDYARNWRLNVLCFDIDENRKSIHGNCQIKAKGKGGDTIAKRTQEDYGRLVINQIENARDLDFPLNDAYTDIKIKQFLKPWLNKNRTYNYLRAVLSIIFSHAVDEGLIRKNMVLDIKPREITKRMIYLNDAIYSAITTEMMKHQPLPLK